MLQKSFYKIVLKEADLFKRLSQFCSVSMENLELEIVEWWFLQPYNKKIDH